MHTALQVTEINMLDVNWLQAAKKLVKLNTSWNSELFVCNIEGEIVFQKLQNILAGKNADERIHSL